MIGLDNRTGISVQRDSLVRNSFVTVEPVIANSIWQFCPPATSMKMPRGFYIALVAKKRWPFFTVFHVGHTRVEVTRGYVKAH